MVRRLEALLHPLWNVTARRDFPVVDAQDMTERFKLLANPESPLPITACEADEDIGHAHRTQAVLPLGSDPGEGMIVAEDTECKRLAPLIVALGRAARARSRLSYAFVASRGLVVRLLPVWHC